MREREREKKTQTYTERTENMSKRTMCREQLGLIDDENIHIDSTSVNVLLCNLEPCLFLLFNYSIYEIARPIFLFLLLLLLFTKT